MKHKLYHNIVSCFIGLFILLNFSSCLKNDIPYPVIQLFVTDLKANGMMGNAIIANDDRTVTITLADTVNLKRVMVTKLSMTDGAQCSLKTPQEIDLTDPYGITLSLYQDYPWKIIGKQTIDRRFSVKGQVGSAEFNTNDKIAIVNVTDDTNLKNIEVKELKLGPTGSTINMSPDNPAIEWSIHGNYAKASVVVNYRDFIVMENWTLYVFQVKSTVNTRSVDAWVNVAWLYGDGKDGADNGFEYKEKDAATWSVLEPASVIHDGGSFVGRLSHLRAQTTYVCRAYSDNEKGQEFTFTTGTVVPLENASFDEWHQQGKIWNPWALNGLQMWDTGNEGATTLGESNTVPVNDIRPGAAVGSRAAKLESKFVGFGSVGKFAAGNLFAGKFLRTEGTNGVLEFGKSFNARPTKLRGYYKYTTASISHASSDYIQLKGKPDTCAIYIALGDWDKPVEIRTNPANSKYFDKNDSHIIAYSELYNGSTTNGYIPFELELDYRSKSRVPKYLIIVCSASKYGDYFTGGVGAILQVDDFVLEYDY